MSQPLNIQNFQLKWKKGEESEVISGCVFLYIPSSSLRGLSWRRNVGMVSQWLSPKEIDESFKEVKLLLEENIKLTIYHAKV